MKLCRMTCHKVGIITWIQHLGGTAPLKFGKAKNVQNLAQFITTFKFDHKYLKNRSIYRKQKKTNFIETNFCCVEQRKFGELLCTNKKRYWCRCWPTQNRLCVRFWTSLEFGREYLWKGLRHQQLETNLIDCHHSRVWWKNNWWTLVHYQKSYKRRCRPTQLNNAHSTYANAF